MALITLAVLKAKIGIADATTTYDTELSAIIDAATYQIQAYLGYDPEATSYTEYLDGTGGKEVVLDCPPVPVSVTAVYEDRERDFGSDTLLTAEEDYVQRKNGSVGLGVIVRLNTVWPFYARREVDRLASTVQSAEGVIKVAYTATNTLVLAVAKRAAQLECQAAWSAAGAGGLGVVTGAGMDGASVTISQTQKAQRRADSADGFVSPLVAGMLSPFAKIKTGR
jgi:hypothetical protein